MKTQNIKINTLRNSSLVRPPVRRRRKKNAALSLVYTKTIFFGILILLAVSIASSGTISTNERIIRLSDLKRIASSLVYEVKFSRANHATFRETLAALFKGEEVSASGGKMASAIPVLVYHGIVETPDRFSMTPETFSDQMFALKKAGFNTVNTGDVLAFVSGKKELPAGSFLLTFDDGRKDSFYGADPILKALNYQAVMFTVVTDSFPKETGPVSSYYLNKQELGSMISTGRWQIESHAKQANGGFVSIDEKGTKANFLSNKMWLSAFNRVETTEEYFERVADELRGSRDFLEKNLGTKVVAFAYPFGDYGQQTKNFYGARDIIHDVMNVTYKLAFHQIWPVDHEYSWNYSHDDPFNLRRIEPSPDWSGARLLQILKNGEAKALPYTDIFEVNHGWKRSWGTVSAGKGSLFTGAVGKATGSFAFLDGSYLWKDYVAESDIDWQAGGHLSLVARFVSELTYATCSFSDHDVRVEEFKGGEKALLVNVKNSFKMPHKGVFAVAVSGQEVGCFVNGNEIATSTLSSEVTYGGVGYKTWDEKLANTAIVVSHLVVTPLKSFKDAREGIKVTKLQELPKPVKPVKPEKPESPKPAPLPEEPPVEPILLDGSFVTNNFIIGPAWKTLLGALSLDEGRLVISSTASTTETFALLPGTEKWSNYSLKAVINWFKGRNFYILARVTDKKNYVMCGYTNYGSSVTGYEVRNGSVKTLGTSPRLSISDQSPWQNFTGSIRVDGDEMKCLIGDEVLLTFTVPTMSNQGGIGIKGYDKDKENSLISVGSIDVEEIKE